MVAVRFQGVLASLLAGVCLSAAACFSTSSNGSGGNTMFPDGGEFDGFGADSTLPEDGGADSAPDVAPEAGAETGTDAPAMTEASQADAADSATTDAALTD